MRYLLLIASFIFLFSCESKRGRVLEEADKIMEHNPDSALVLLKNVNRNSLKKSELPYYSLLYTQAQIKTDIPLYSDSLISIAYSRYGNSNKGDLGLRSNFYMGEVLFNQQKNPQAMHFFLTTYENSKRLGNNYWRAKSGERISDLFFYAYNYDESVKYANEAASLFKEEGRITFHRHMLAALGNIYVCKGDNEKAISLLDSLKQIVISERTTDSLLLDNINYYLTDAKTRIGDTDGSFKLDSIKFLQHTTDNQEIIDAAILLSRYHNSEGKPEETTELLRQVQTLASTNDYGVHVLYARYKNAKATGDSSLALSLVDSLLYFQNKVAEDIIHESIIGAQRDFYTQEAIRQENDAFFFKTLLFVLVILLSFIIFFVITLLHLKHKAYRIKLDASLDSLLTLRASSSQIIKENESLEKEIRNKDNLLQATLKEKNQLAVTHAHIVERLFKEKWKTLDKLCDQYFSLHNSEVSEKTILSNMQREVKQIISKDGLSEIVEAVDIYMGGIVSDLRSQCPFLKDRDINYLALSYAGFSVRAVCLFLGIKYQHYYVKRSRLIKRIQNSDAPNKESFISKLK